MRRTGPVWAVILAGLLLAAGCGSPQAFRGTVVAPLETISAFTPGPERLELTPRPVPAEGETRPPTPTPRPSTFTPRPDTPTPRPTTPTPRPATPTPRPATPSTGQPTPDPRAYLGVVQYVGRLGQVWSLSDLRVGIHPDRVRVVWEMAEARDTVPYTEIVEVDNLRTPFPRRGALMDPTWGEARIDIMISDCSAMGLALDDMLPITLPETAIITRIGLHPTFDDAVLGFSIGLEKPAAYEVFTLTDPVRIVIDVITGSP